MRSPLISVIMPVYNGVATLNRALESVRQQQVDDWELLIVDDASTDGSGEAAARWAGGDPRVRVLRSEENRGPGAARNLGLQQARGEFVCYLDCDDEFDPDYFGHIRRMRAGSDVLLFRYEIVDPPGPNGESRVRNWDPAALRQAMFTSRNVATPLGVAHRRELIAQAGGFNELLWCDEDSDLWRRLARAGARFAFLPLKSGRYYVRRHSRSRVPRLPEWQRRKLEAHRRAGKPLYGPPQGPRRGKVRKIAFASPHSLIDFTSGAAIATGRTLQFLSDLGFQCSAFCGCRLDAPEEGLLEEMLAEQGSPYEAKKVRIGGYVGRMIFALQEKVPVTLFAGASTRGRWADASEPRAFLAAYETFLDRNRPDAVMTYGGDPVSRALIELTKSRDIPVVFALHNFSYPSTSAFREADYVVVPSEFSRDWHWDHLGLACHTLPNVIDWKSVEVAEREPRYVTFVNPHAVKGVYVFARIAQELARRRPDIPLLVVEGRSGARTLAQTGIDPSGLDNLTTMPNTADPRDFYRVSKLVLVPSLWKESFGLVPAEAMTGGIPVLASDRGSLPEIVGEAGFLLPIPTRYQPETRLVPAASEVEPWVEAVIRLWDDEAAYLTASLRSRQRARSWHPDQLGPRYRRFFESMVPQPGPPFVPRGDSADK